MYVYLCAWFSWLTQQLILVPWALSVIFPTLTCRPCCQVAGVAHTFLFLRFARKRERNFFNWF